MITQPLPKRIMTKKLVTFIILGLLFALMLTYYSQNKEMINNYKPYYLKSYWYAAEDFLFNNREEAPTQNQTIAAKSVPVLVYHGLIAKPDKVSTSLEEFKDDMFALKTAGYQTVRLADFQAYIQGKKTLPDKSFLLTFDDARKDSYYPADPILKELHYSAVMFVITDTLDSKTNRFHLTKSELIKMKNPGRWELEVHTYEGHGLIDLNANGTKGHFYSNKMWLKIENRLETDEEFRSRVRQDMLQAKLEMKTNFNIAATAFAFPFNDYARDSLNFPEAQAIFTEESKKAYPLLFYQVEPQKDFSANLYNSQVQLIRRINRETYWDTNTLISMIKSSREKTLPLKYDHFDATQNWIIYKGTLFFNKKELTFEAKPNENSAIVILNGSNSFDNIDLEMNVLIDKGTDFSIILNQREPQNYYLATIKKDEILIEKVIAGQSQTIFIKPINLPVYNAEHNIHLIKFNNLVRLSIDGKKVLTDFNLNDQANHGGIGFMIWNQNTVNAVATIKRLVIKNAN